MAKLQNSSFYVREEFKEGLLLVKKQYQNGVDILTILADISQYAREHTSSEKEKISLFKYLILYLKHLAQLDRDDIFMGEIETLTEDTEDVIDPELFEFMREVIEEE